MVKRFHFAIFKSLTSGHTVKAEIQEKPDGPYVRFEDFQKAVEAANYLLKPCKDGNSLFHVNDGLTKLRQTLKELGVGDE
jgi:hypothetical protein